MDSVFPILGPIALLTLASGIVTRGIRLTVTALVGLIALAIVAIPVCSHSNMAGLVAMEVAAVVALAALFFWRSTGRYPMFAAVATFIVGAAASLLLIVAAV